MTLPGGEIPNFPPWILHDFNGIKNIQRFISGEDLVKIISGL